MIWGASCRYVGLRTILPLHGYQGEYVAFVCWQPGTVFRQYGHYGGEEIYVMEGTFQDEYGSYPAGSWIRNPIDFPIIRSAMKAV